MTDIEVKGTKVGCIYVYRPFWDAVGIQRFVKLLDIQWWVLDTRCHLANAVEWDELYWN
jgi:hypothetical protein